MTWLVLTNASSGATRNAGTNGDLCTLLDWALPQAGWAIEYTASNARVYRPGSGLRNRLYVQHDSAVSGNAGLATVRGCENASSATVLVDPFPLVAQIANNASNWLVSNTANTTDRPFRIYLSETFVFYFSQASTTAEAWDMGFFGDVSPAFSGDSWYTVCDIRNSTGVVVGPGLGQTCGAAVVAGSNLFWCRDVTGATKSSRGVIYASGTGGTGMGALTGGTGARVSYQNRIYREKVGATDGASTSTTTSALGLPKRGWIPNLWNPLHLGRGTVSDVDTFTDTTYNPLASFRLLSAASAQCTIIEETDTWSAP